MVTLFSALWGPRSCAAHDRSHQRCTAGQTRYKWGQCGKHTIGNSVDKQTNGDSVGKHMQMGTVWVNKKMETEWVNT